MQTQGSVQIRHIVSLMHALSADRQTPQVNRDILDGSHWDQPRLSRGRLDTNSKTGSGVYRYPDSHSVATTTMFIAKVFVRLLSAIIAAVIPFIFGRELYRRHHDCSWDMFRTGCWTFVISQVFHIPFNIIVSNLIGIKDSMPEGPALVYYSIFLGLSAGVFEETTRYFAYRCRLTSPETRTYWAALMFGTGHGGIESILLIGIGGLCQLIAMIVLKFTNLENANFPPDQIPLIEKAIQEYWSTPWYAFLMADVERIFTIIIHVTMTVMVLQCFCSSQVKSRQWMLLLAILWHAGLDSLAVLVTIKYNAYLAELIVVLWTLASLAILQYFYKHHMDREIVTSDPVEESEPLNLSSEEQPEQIWTETEILR